jgi:hypothetical protein
VIRRFLKSLAALVRAAWVGEEETYCDGCKKFSKGNVCPYCP